MAAPGVGLARIPRPALARRLVDAFDAGSVVLTAGAGYGKTMALEEAIDASARRAVWVSCGSAGGEAGRLLTAIVDGMRLAVPGLADVVGDRLAAGLEQIDVTVVTGVLADELERLLPEPLVITFDDAEELENANEALALVDRLLAVRNAPLSVAVASRRPLPLKLAKLRAEGRLTEVGPSDLAFTVGECQQLLTLRQGSSVSEEEVESVAAASEGWPMGVALTGLSRPGGTEAGAASQPELFGYLAEEVLDGLDPQTRFALVDSSVPDVLTAPLIADLGLPAGFVADAERRGVFLRRHPAGAYSYHPLFRAFLRERLRDLRTEAERGSLHERAAVSLAAAGRHAEAIEHWLEAGRFEKALEALATHGGELLRTSPGTVARWLSALSPELGSEPDYLFLDAQLQSGAGHHARALESFRAAVSGYQAAGNHDREWLARVFIADALVFTSAFEDVSAVADGWDQVDGPAAGAAAMAVAWYDVVALSALGRLDDAEALRRRLSRDPAAAVAFKFLDVVALSGTELTAGPADAALTRLRSAIAELELSDPFGRLPYALGMGLLVLRGLGQRGVGDRAAALEWLDRCEVESERVGLGFALRDFRLQRASLLAQDGDLPGAEAALSRAGRRRDSGWRGVYEAEAEAHVASARGDAAGAAEAAARALTIIEPGPMPWRVLTTVEMAGVLTGAAEPERARAAIAAALATLDELFPAARGRHLRAWLLAARACVEYATGSPDEACRTVAAAWDEAGDEAGLMVRAQWPAIRPVLWHALAEGALAPDTVLPELQSAFPGGEALVAMTGHPDAAVRRAALLAALSASHPDAVGQLAALAEDADEQVRAAAVATRDRLRGNPPPLRYELLGGFHVSRGGWRIDDAAWQRPMAARVVRFLLVQGTGSVPEDDLFDAFWPDRPADSARQHLTVAVSRARKVLDLPDAEHSVIEAKERVYRLRPREHDSVDARQFETAAAAALATGGADRQAALEGAAALWKGEPLPEDRYAAWALVWRERLIETYSAVLTALVETYIASGEHQQAIRAASRILELDPLDERAHRQLMVAYARTGRTSQALRQFLECRRALIEDSGLEPAADTSRLQTRILAGEPV